MLQAKLQVGLAATCSGLTAGLCCFCFSCFRSAAGGMVGIIGMTGAAVMPTAPCLVGIAAMAGAAVIGADALIAVSGLDETSLAPQEPQNF